MCECIIDNHPRRLHERVTSKGHENQVTIDPLRARIYGGDRQALRRASEAERAASLRRLLDEEVQRPDIDCEMLGKAAWFLEGLRFWSVPAVAIAWLKEQPTHERLTVVLSLLVVSWNSQPNEPRPEPALVEALLSVYDGLPYDPIGENTLLIVLMQASHSGLPAPLAARVRGILERARAVPDRAPNILEMLDDFLGTPSDSGIACSPTGSVTLVCVAVGFRQRLGELLESLQRLVVLPVLLVRRALLAWKAKKAS